MSEWEALTDEAGRTYYYNSSTNETSWTLPSSTASQWQAFKTDDGKEYYYNESTGVTTWDKPEGFESVAEEADESVDAPERVSKSVKESETTSDPLDTELEGKPTSSDELIKPPQYDTVSEAESAFTDMLKENKVDSTWSFQSVMSKFIKNPTYWAIDDALHRKKLYDDYLVNKLKEELSDKTSVVEKFETNFKSVLQEYQARGIFKHNTRWINVKNKLIEEDNSIFKHSILSDNEIWEIFNSFRSGLKEEHDKSIQAQKSQALLELEAYLTQINPAIVKQSKDWEELYERLQQDSRFHANKHFSVLSKVDILDLYRTKIYPTSLSALKSEVTRMEKINYRSDRKARDNFKALLSAISIGASTTFKQVFELIENEDAFIELCGRNGSTPIEYFWDIVDEKNQLLRLKKEWIQGVMNDITKADSSISVNTILESKAQFVKVLSRSNDERLKNIDFSMSDKEGQEEIESLYDGILKDQEAQKEEAKAIFAQALKVQIQSFSEWLYTNNEKVKLFNHLEGQKESSEDSEARPGVVDLVSSKNDDGSLSYALTTEFDSAKVLSAMQSLDSFKPIEEAIRGFHGSPETVQGVLDKTSRDAVQEYVVVLNSKQRKRRVRGADDERDAKRARVDEPAKPITMNY